MGNIDQKRFCFLKQNNTKLINTFNTSQMII
jgi:hypothetical protein